MLYRTVLYCTCRVSHECVARHTGHIRQHPHLVSFLDSAVLRLGDKQPDQQSSRGGLVSAVLIRCYLQMPDTKISRVYGYRG